MNITTERLMLRQMELQDKDAVFEYRRDKDTNKFQSFIPESISDVETFINKNAKIADQPDSWYQLVIIEKQSEIIIGDIGIHFTGSENKQIEVGCTLSRQYQKLGYASEALKSLISNLFAQYDKHRVFVSIDPQNIDSMLLVERLGFRKEAHFVESLYINGEWVDDIIYAILAREWNK